MRKLRVPARTRASQTLPSVLSSTAAPDHFLRRGHAASVERGVVEPLRGEGRAGASKLSLYQTSTLRN